MKGDEDFVRSISGASEHSGADRAELSPEEMAAIVEGGTTDQRVELALSEDLPQNVSSRLLQDDDLGVVAAVLWTNTLARADLARLESRLRGMSQSEDVIAVLLRLGEQPHASTPAKLEVRFNDLQPERIKEALDELGVIGTTRARVLGTWRKNRKRELWTFRQVLEAVGVDAGIWPNA